MKKIISFMFFACMSSGIIAQPPNNAIFSGSIGDGFSKKNNIVASNSIFLGGNGDGFSRTSNLVLSNNIFLGGNGDGWSASKNLIASNSIFLGGNGDGWTNAKNASVSNSIFLGSTGDGWSNALNVSASNNIFFGGPGDGWSSVYKPTGPLPVTLLSFNIQKLANRRVKLDWKTATELNSDYFDVERSTDAVNFIAIGRVAAAGMSSTLRNYTFIDDQPAMGANYYRLKQVDRNSDFVYSPSRLASFDDVSGPVKYYPNPTRGQVNIELSAEMMQSYTVINISNTAGAVIYQQRLKPGASQVITLDLSRFAKGVYVIQVKSLTEQSVERLVLQ